MLTGFEDCTADTTLLNINASAKRVFVHGTKTHFNVQVEKKRIFEVQRGRSWSTSERYMAALNVVRLKSRIQCQADKHQRRNMHGGVRQLERIQNPNKDCQSIEIASSKTIYLKKRSSTSDLKSNQQVIMT